MRAMLFTLLVLLSAPAAAPAGADPHWPVVRVGTVHWQGGDLAFTDRARGSDATLRLRDVDLHGDGLAIGVDAPPGRIGVAAVLPGIAVPFGFEPTVRTEFRLPQPSKPNDVMTFNAGLFGSTTCCVIRHATGSVTYVVVCVTATWSGAVLVVERLAGRPRHQLPDTSFA